MTDRMKYALSGAAAGAVNGLFGGGGGMVLAPALTGWCHMEQKRALATCVAAILPLCLLSAAISLWRQPLDWMQALPYLLGGLGGGFVGGRLFQKVSNLWPRRIFACFLLYGGVRSLLCRCGCCRWRAPPKWGFTASPKRRARAPTTLSMKSTPARARTRG